MIGCFLGKDILQLFEMWHSGLEYAMMCIECAYTKDQDLGIFCVNFYTSRLAVTGSDAEWHIGLGEPPL